MPRSRNPVMAIVSARVWARLAGAVFGGASAFAVYSLAHWSGMQPPPVGEQFPEPAREDSGVALPSPVQASPSPSATPSPTPASILDIERERALQKLEVLGKQPNGDNLASVAASGAIDDLELLLQAGVSPDATTADRQPALLLACENGQGPAALRLLEAGASPNAKSADGRTALMASAERDEPDLLSRLAQFGADTQQKDQQGHSALQYALRARAYLALEWLLDFGAPMEDACCDNHGSPLIHALESSDPTLISLLLQAQRRAHPLPWSRTTREALFAALRAQNKPIVRVLLRNHPEPPTPEGFRQPLLAYAIAWHEVPLLRLLLECGADPNTPLGNPVERAFARLVPDENARFYFAKETGITPLMLSSLTGHLDCVEALLQYGAQRGKLTGRYKMAAISFAAHYKRSDIMQVLLGKSPNPEDQHIRIEISLGNQRAVLWKDNRAVLSAPISTGRSGFPTPSGSFVITDKERMRYSSIYKVSMPYFMRLNCSEFGMHEGVVPNYPASHGCIRLPREAAIRFFHEVEMGNLVTINP
ncbi:MAG: ankyrin repeat domain-containing protein [Verrucomicrobiota bacterium]